MRNVLLFAGAGASKAVDPEAYPTTVEFFERLPGAVTNDTLFALLTKRLRRGKEDTIVDIEQVLWGLQELQTFLETVSSRDSVPGWFLQDGRLLQPIGVTTDFKNLTENAPRVLDFLRRLRNAIDQQVYELYGQVPTESQLLTNWLRLLDALLTIDLRVDIFTTNYDRVIEVALRHVRSSSVTRVDTGRRDDDVERYLNEQTWTESPTRSGGEVGRLRKLHGLGDWSWDQSRKRIFVSDPLFKGDHARHVILYPGFKGVPDKAPFNYFHSYFASRLAVVDHLVFIGFAFRDEYINDMLQRFTAPRAVVTVVNPAQVQSPFAGPIKHVAAPFAAEAVKQVLAQIETAG